MTHFNVKHIFLTFCLISTICVLANIKTEEGRENSLTDATNFNNNILLRSPRNTTNNDNDDTAAKEVTCILWVCSSMDANLFYTIFCLCGFFLSGIVFIAWRNFEGKLTENPTFQRYIHGGRRFSKEAPQQAQNDMSNNPNILRGMPPPEKESTNQNEQHFHFLNKE